MHSDSLTQRKFLEIIDKSQYPFQMYREFKEYIPDYLYKFSSFCMQEEEKKNRMQQLVNGEIWFSSKEFLNDPFEFEHLVLGAASPEAQQYYIEKQKELELFCLTASPLNKLMWSHYADSYRGFCVEYRVTGKEWLFPVIYDDALPDMSMSYQNFYSNRCVLDVCSPEGQEEIGKDIIRLEYPLISKDRCWSYEKEFRIVTSIDEGECPSNGHLRKADRYGLYASAIIVGSNCPANDLALMKKTVEEINIERDNQKKAKILRLREHGVKYKDDVDHGVKKILDDMPEFSPVTLKQLTWNETLQLTTKNYIGETTWTK